MHRGFNRSGNGGGEVRELATTKYTKHTKKKDWFAEGGLVSGNGFGGVWD